jgi:hypothetical protein
LSVNEEGANGIHRFINLCFSAFIGGRFYSFVPFFYFASFAGKISGRAKSPGHLTLPLNLKICSKAAAGRK